jgi:hypothetical protein
LTSRESTDGPFTNLSMGKQKANSYRTFRKHSTGRIAAFLSAGHEVACVVLSVEITMGARPFVLAASLFFLATGLLGNQVSVHAADREEVLIRKGVELRRKGKNQEALASFQRAYEVTHTGRAAAQLGLCEQALKQWLGAHIHLTDALAAESDIWISEHRAILANALVEVKRQLGRVEVRGSPKGGLVVVNGEVSGRLAEDIAVPVLPGEVTVAVTAEGYARQEQNHRVEAGQILALNIALLPVAPESKKPHIENLDLASRNGASATSTLQPDSPPTNLRRDSRVATYSFLAAGSAASLAGALFAIRSSSLAEEASTADTYDPAKEDSAKASRTISKLCFAAGAVSLTVGAILYFRLGESMQVAFSTNNLSNDAAMSLRGYF